MTTARRADSWGGFVRAAVIAVVVIVATFVAYAAPVLGHEARSRASWTW